MTATVEKAKKLLVPNGAQSLKKTSSRDKRKHSHPYNLLALHVV
jgi:hypothetical protein